jgi:hypothetical protein
MATRTIVTLIDDLDGSEAASRVAFAYRGTNYEIDLSEEHQAELRAALAKFIVAARKTGSMPLPADPLAAPTAASLRRDQAAIRAWARKSGNKVALRGQVPIEVQKAYDAAH